MGTAKFNLIPAIAAGPRAEAGAAARSE